MDAQTIRTTKGRGMLYDSILDTVGDTPVVRINNLAPKGVRVYVKVESFNPAASVKDRLALNIIEAAERAGTLKPGQTVVEATSGNTGIGLAMVCAQKGYPLVVTMADSFSVERRRRSELALSRSAAWRLRAFAARTRWSSRTPRASNRATARRRSSPGGPAPSALRSSSTRRRRRGTR